MEQCQHAESGFLTLTYSDEHLPQAYHRETDTWIPTLVKSHPQSFIRSVRKKGYALRYFTAGEYGEKTLRPHYHLITFGLGPGAIDLFKEIWTYGFVSLYEANARTMSYVAKYCLKGSADPEPLSPTFTPHGQDTIPPEDERTTIAPFRLTSRSPPIGGAFAASISRSLRTGRQGNHVLVEPDATLTKSYRRGKDLYPIDKTIRLATVADLVSNGVSPDQADAIFNNEYPEPTREEVQKAQVNHKKARHRRHNRAKL